MVVFGQPEGGICGDVNYTPPSIVRKVGFGEESMNGIDGRFSELKCYNYNVNYPGIPGHPSPTDTHTMP